VGKTGIARRRRAAGDASAAAEKLGCRRTCGIFFGALAAGRRYKLESRPGMKPK